MTRNAIILLLALGASAEVPHWMGQVKQTGYPSVDSILAPFRSFQSKLVKQRAQSPNSRHLQDGPSAECMAACPGAQDFFTAYTSAPPGPEDSEIEAAIKMCPHVDAVVCINKAEACGADGSEEDSSEMMKCMCKCPDLFLAIETMESKGDSTPMCSDKCSTFGCVESNTECAPLREGAPEIRSQCPDPEPDLKCTGAPAPEPAVVTVAFEIKGISLADLDDAAQDGLKKDLAKGLADETGVPQDKITITLDEASRRLAEGRRLAGGIKVKAEIETDDPDTVESKTKNTDTTALVKDSPTIQKVAEEKGISMDDISATEPTVTVKQGSTKQAAVASVASGSGVALSAVLVMMAAWWSSKFCA